MEKLINVVAVIGPTASGKTNLSVNLAKKFNGEIISADSMQIYKDMQIATAKPTKEEMQNIPHYLMDFLEPTKSYSVGMFVNDAKYYIDKIVSNNKLPFIVGGTGLYIDSLLNNIQFNDEQRNETTTHKYIELLNDKGIDYLLDMLKKIDIVSYNNLCEQKNAKRIIRALEFYDTTGTTISKQNELSKQIKSPYNTLKIGLTCKNREFLYDRINYRVDKMIEEGLIDEAKKVFNSTLSNTSEKAIGYKEIFPYFRGETTLDSSIELLKKNTRHYAKRQLTWFRRDSSINWINLDEYSSSEEIFKKAVSIIKEGNIING